MFDSNKNVFLVTTCFIITIGIFLYLCHKINTDHDQPGENKTKQAFLRNVHISSVAVITGGRNIAFESGTAITNAPASYLNLLDCCESDEAISSRIAVGQTRCRIVKGH